MTCKNAVKRLSFVIMYIFDQHKIQEMYEMLFSKTLSCFVPNCYENQKMINKVVHTHPSEI